MKQNLLYRLRYALIATCTILLAVAIETNYFNSHVSDRHFVSFQKVILEKQKHADKLCKEIISLPESADFQTYESYRKQHKSLFGNQRLSFFIFTHDTITYWSDNTVVTNYSLFKNAGNLLFTGNNWYLVSHAQEGKREVFFLTFIKSQYSFSNEYIKTEFHPDFNLNGNIEIYSDSCDDTYPIYDTNNHFLFSLSKTAERSTNIIQCYTAIILYFIGIIFLLIFLNSIIKSFKKTHWRVLLNGIAIAFLILLRWYMIQKQIPYIGYTSDLFNSEYFSMPFTPSLGDLMFNCMILAYFVIVLARNFNSCEFVTRKQRTLSLLSLAVISSAYWVVCTKIFSALVLNSLINLKLFNILNINGLSVAAYSIIAFLLFLYFYMLYSFFHQKKGLLTAVDAVKYCVVSIVLSLLCSLGLSTTFLGFEVFFILINVAFCLFALLKKFHLNVLKILLLLISALFVEIVIAHFVRIKDLSLQRQTAIELATEQDPVAESFLTYVYKDSRKDKTLMSLAQQPDNKDIEIRNYLQEKYFNGFLKQYELECTVCGTDSRFSSSNQLANCEKFFNRMLLTSGESVSDSNYYYINNQDGNITYFDSIRYNLPNGTSTKLYIELHSKTNSLNFGYPTILLNKEISKKTLSDFSSAKYKNGLLVSKTGNWPYSQVLQSYDSQENETQTDSNFQTIVDKQHAIVHLSYKINDQFTVVVSNRILKWNNYLIWFPYIFLYFYVLLLIFNLFSTQNESTLKHSLSAQIKNSLIGLLFATFAIVGIFGASFMKTRNDRLQINFLEEKMRIIATEFSSEYKDYTTFSAQDVATIQRLLSNLAENHTSDINLYGTNGNLIASSRPEIFQYKLQYEKMSPSAFDFLIARNHSRYTHHETIGSLEFLSAYTSITNGQNQILGYLNLPNFSNQQEFTQQFAGLIVGMLNLFVILMLLATISSAFIAKKITDPLTIIQNKMRKVTIGNENEKIEMSVPNELTGLIKNYNTMIDQLSISADKLAKAERENAWQEMARQIAHEIKNPLTPMKLNLQLLNRSWDEKDPKFETRLKSISKTMIEQIDTLADTATSFSDFAKLSKVTLTSVNINELLQNCVTLFTQEEKSDVTANLPAEPVFINADKDKTTRLFNNLIKNAIQAIPSDRHGNVVVSLSADSDYATISVADNGRGIDDETKQHIFQLHFTTKETGSGFGLAICKNIVESSGGKIWFETELNKGSIFFVKLPLQKE